MREPSPRGGPRQTRSYLIELMEATGLRPRRQLGQNFLIDLNLLGLLVEAAALEPDDVVLEVGAGTGGLTARLAERAARVVSVEIDPGFFALAQRETSRFSNVELIHTDILAGKNKLRPEVTQAVATALAAAGQDHYHLVANLPYDVAASVVGNLLVDDLPIRSLVFTVQLEMAQRITSEPGSKDYGPLSVLVQRLGAAAWIRTLPPEAFWPRPKVHSAILRIDVDPARRTDLADVRAMHRFVRDLFLHRRKNLRAAIASIPGYKRLKPALDEVLAGLGLAPDDRAERLGHEQLHTLHQKLKALAAESPED